MTEHRNRNADLERRLERETERARLEQHDDTYAHNYHKTPADQDACPVCNPEENS